MDEPIAQLNAARIAAVAALQARNWSEAKLQAAIAVGVLATVPNSQIAGVSSQSWDRNAIRVFIDAIQTAEDSVTADSAGCGPVFCDVEYTGLRSDGGCEC